LRIGEALPGIPQERLSTDRARRRRLCRGNQFVSPERLETIQKERTSKEVEWLTEEDVAERLRALRADHSQWRIAQDTGQFSLAGAQPKTALLFEWQRWGIPSGRIPTLLVSIPRANTKMRAGRMRPEL
jgi:hypothetical protein